jgi:hypothetical protein
MGFKMDEASIDDALNIIKENKEKPFDLLAEIERRLRLTEDDDAVVSPTEKIDIKLPVLKISEAWGRTGNTDREIIESFASKIQGASLEQKLASLNGILDGKGVGKDVSGLLSTMMICEILSSILRDFTESAGGFVFEGFLAGLFGGKSVQITKPEDIEGMDAAGKPITDVVLNDRHYSLKLLGQTTGVKGSFRNMVEHFDAIDHVVYLDARRIGGDKGLEFGEFEITLPGFLDVFVTPFLRQVTTRDVEVKSAAEFKKLLQKLDTEGKPVKTVAFSKGNFIPGRTARVFGYSPSAQSVLTEELLQEVGVSGEDLKKILARVVQMEDEELQQFAPFVIDHAERKFEKTKAEKLFGSMAVVDILKRTIETGDKDAIINSLKQTPGYKGKQQFEFTRQQAEDIANFKVVGTLMVGEERMKGVWKAYAKTLQEVINPVYGNLQEFTNNINAYLLGTGGGDRKSRGQQALQDAEQLKVATDAAIKIVTPSDGPGADVTPVDATPSAGDARAASRARRRRAGAGVSNPMSRGTRRE